MPSLSYRIDPDLLTQFPGYVRGVLVFSGLDNQGAHATLTQALRAAEGQARTRVTGNVSEWPPVAAWREAYRRFGAKPAEHHSAIEALMRRVLKQGQLPDINPLVDIGNLLSVQHGLPAGMHPLGDGDEVLELRAAREGDRFAPADGAPDESPPAGEVVLAAGTQVLTRRWTWRQAAATRTLPETTAVFLNVDGLPPVGAAQVEAAMAQAEGLVLQHCGGRLVGRALLGAAQPQARFDW